MGTGKVGGVGGGGHGVGEWRRAWRVRGGRVRGEEVRGGIYTYILIYICVLIIYICIFRDSPR